MHYVYILYSAGADKYYVGQTSDIEQRRLYHNEISKKSYTTRYRPWALKAVIEAGSRGQALRMERYVKRQKDRGYIERLIVSAEERLSLQARFGE